MFRFLSRRTYHGKREFDRFKELLSERAVLEALVTQSTGGSVRMSLDMAGSIQEAINLLQSLTSMVSMDAMQILELASEKKWSAIEKPLVEFSRVFESYKSDNAPRLKALVRWADTNRLPVLEPFNSLVYKQTGFPRDEDELLSLRFLHLPGAGIESIPNEICVLPMVMGVCLSGNAIRSIPTGLCSMPSVYRLDLDDNLIEEVPGEISGMKQLQAIDLDENMIRQIPSSLRSMRSLKSLLVSNQKHGRDLLSAGTPLSEEGVSVLRALDGRYDFKLRT
ncbi:MAG TPA: hypothetical protein DFS52_24475 [Myxococcales bacterium]|nr:hypothetical protein [Myxococcales bacterium]